jgi:hypothetical protein
LATQIAEALARGRGIGRFAMPRSRRKVLYVDLVMTELDVARRYAYEEGTNRELKCYEFSRSLYRGRPKNVDGLINWLKDAIKENGFQVVVIDDLAALTNTHEGTRETLKLMRQLKGIKDESGAAILVLATSAEQKSGAGVSEADLGRWRVLCNAADSVFAIGRRANGDGRIIQTRSRNAVPVWNVHNGPVCRVQRTDEMLLGFVFDERFAERYDQETIRQIVKINAMRKADVAFRTIGKELGMSPAKALRLSRKWTREMETATADNGQGPVAGGQETGQAGDGTQNGWQEPEEWQEGEFEKPEWIEFERGTPASGVGGEKTDGGTPEARAASWPMDVSRIPFAAGLGRRSIYDLKRVLNDYDQEIFVETECEKTGKPMIWYQVNNKGYVVRWVRRGGGPDGTTLGPASYIEVGGWQRESSGWLKLVGEKWELTLMRRLEAELRSASAKE